MRVHLTKSLLHIKALRQSSKSPWLFLCSSSYCDAPHKKSKLAPLQVATFLPLSHQALFFPLFFIRLSFSKATYLRIFGIFLSFFVGKENDRQVQALC